MEVGPAAMISCLFASVTATVITVGAYGSRRAEAMSAAANSTGAPAPVSRMPAACEAVGSAILSSKSSLTVPSPSLSSAPLRSGPTTSSLVSTLLSSMIPIGLPARSRTAHLQMSSCGDSMAMTACLCLSGSSNSTVDASDAVVIRPVSGTPPWAWPRSRMLRLEPSTEAISTSSLNVAENTPVPSLNEARSRTGSMSSETLTCGDAVEFSASPAASATSPGPLTYWSRTSGLVSGRSRERPSTRVLLDGAGYFETVMPDASGPCSTHVSDGLVAVPNTASLNVTSMELGEPARADSMVGAKSDAVMGMVADATAVPAASARSPAAAE